MFTGIVKDMGTVVAKIPNREGCLFTVSSPNLIDEIAVDDSVAINGVCQTVISKKKQSFNVQCVHVSLEKTSLGKLKAGDKVNLELALRMSDRLGGHVVQGHVNGTGSVKSIKRLGENRLIAFRVPKELFRYIIPEGSIAINGVSLTVAKVFSEFNVFEVSVIPHTLDVTTFGSLKVGSVVNIEIDMVAKYIENFVKRGMYEHI